MDSSNTDSSNIDSSSLDQIKTFIKNTWEKSIVPELKHYITIPCKSPAFDKNWQENNYLNQVVNQFKKWVLAQDIPNLQLEIINLPNRTPLLYIEVPATDPKQTSGTILLYGHLDKQPEMAGWDADKGPWQPVIINNKLYGRGGADDGYALFAAITAIKSLAEHNINYPRCVIIIEACEESGSYDLPFYVDHLKDKFEHSKQPSLVICLDSGCGNYDQFWLTTSLRGNIKGVLEVSLLTEGVHSGAASGLVASSFRVIRSLLSRIEDERTGEILLADLYCDIPPERITEAQHTAEILNNSVYDQLPFGDNHHSKIKPVCDNHTELLLNRTWRPQLAITGAAGLPELSQAGNVMRPKTSLMLSMRLPPNIKANSAKTELIKALESNPPYNAKVTFTLKEMASGWNAPPTAAWLQQAVNNASNLIFNKPAACWGEGGTIPFMSMLGEKFPYAQFVITGVLGPKSNAHGPNEFLHLDMAEKLTCCVAYIINAFCEKN
jgi:acetylornithine deacetylase/succinyl-diaminopimelate desuccinylase-like protein